MSARLADASEAGARPALRFWLQRTEEALGQADYFLASTNSLAEVDPGYWKSFVF